MRPTLCLALLLLAAPVAAQQAAPVAPSAEPKAKAEASPSKLPLEEIQRYVTVFNTVKEAYVEPVEDKKLMQSAIRGLLMDLDPHSAYLQKDAADAFDEQAMGRYAGIGVELQAQADNTLLVIAPIDDTPASRAGIKAGDLIIAVDGKPLPDDDSMAPLKGVPGSKVKLTVLREGKRKPFDVALVREEIRIASVNSRVLEPGYGYVRIAAFQADTGAEFKKQVAALQAKNELKGLVLDLRSNPGGLLTAAVEVADSLLDKGVIVSTRGRMPISDSEFKATPGDLLGGAPVVVLVDAGSASASEVLAGALRDNARARIVGSRTFGKGSVQTVLSLGNGDSIKLTTARYFTPSGKSIQASGIVPEVVFKPQAEEKTDKPEKTLDADAAVIDYSEAALPGHLHGDDEGADGYRPGDVLSGEGFITQALAVLKQPAKAGVTAASNSE